MVSLRPDASRRRPVRYEEEQTPPPENRFPRRSTTMATTAPRAALAEPEVAANSVFPTLAHGDPRETPGNALLHLGRDVRWLTSYLHFLPDVQAAATGLPAEQAAAILPTAQETQKFVAEFLNATREELQVEYEKWKKDRVHDAAARASGTAVDGAAPQPRRAATAHIGLQTSHGAQGTQGAQGTRAMNAEEATEEEETDIFNDALEEMMTDEEAPSLQQKSPWSCLEDRLKLAIMYQLVTPDTTFWEAVRALRITHDEVTHFMEVYTEEIGKFERYEQYMACVEAGVAYLNPARGGEQSISEFFGVKYRTERMTELEVYKGVLYLASECVDLDAQDLRQWVERPPSGLIGQHFAMGDEPEEAQQVTGPPQAADPRRSMIESLLDAPEYSGMDVDQDVDQDENNLISDTHNGNGAAADHAASGANAAADSQTAALRVAEAGSPVPENAAPELPGTIDADAMDLDVEGHDSMPSIHAQDLALQNAVQGSEFDEAIDLIGNSPNKPDISDNGIGGSWMELDDPATAGQPQGDKKEQKLRSSLGESGYGSQGEEAQQDHENKEKEGNNNNNNNDNNNRDNDDDDQARKHDNNEKADEKKDKNNNKHGGKERPHQPSSDGAHLPENERTGAGQETQAVQGSQLPHVPGHQAKNKAVPRVHRPLLPRPVGPQQTAAKIKTPKTHAVVDLTGSTTSASQPFQPAQPPASQPFQPAQPPAAPVAAPTLVLPPGRTRRTTRPKKRHNYNVASAYEQLGPDDTVDFLAEAASKQDAKGDQSWRGDPRRL